MIAFHFLPTIHQFQKKSQKQRLLLFRPLRVKKKLIQKKMSDLFKKLEDLQQEFQQDYESHVQRT
jgi:phage-related protein